MNDKKWHTCNNCGKNLSCYKSLWRHKKKCRPAPYHVPVRDSSPMHSPMKSSVRPSMRSPVREKSPEIPENLRGKFLSPEESLELRNTIRKMEAKSLNSHPVEDRKNLKRKREEEETYTEKPKREEEHIPLKRKREDSGTDSDSSPQKERTPENSEKHESDSYDTEADVWIDTDTEGDAWIDTDSVADAWIDTDSVADAWIDTDSDVPHLPGLFKDLTNAILGKGEYKHILDELLKQDALSPSEHAMFHTRISFLPRDTEGLWEKLKVLGAEYKAGNTTTRNELVAVLDELKRQGAISKEEYINMNTFLGRGLSDAPREGDEDSQDDGNSESDTEVSEVILRKGSGIDDLWQSLKILGPEYKAGNSSKEMLVILDKLLKENEISKEEYNTMLRRGGGIDTVRNGLNTTYVKRLEEIMKSIEVEDLAELIQQYVKGNHKVREEIDRILETSKVKKSTIAEIEMILNCIDYM